MGEMTEMNDLVKAMKGVQRAYIANFGKILIIPTPDLDLYENNQSHVLLHDPKFSLDYESWATSHNVKNAFGWKLAEVS